MQPKNLDARKTTISCSIHEINEKIIKSLSSAVMESRIFVCCFVIYGLNIVSKLWKFSVVIRVNLLNVSVSSNLISHKRRLKNPNSPFSIHDLVQIVLFLAAFRRQRLRKTSQIASTNCFLLMAAAILKYRLSQICHCVCGLCRFSSISIVRQKSPRVRRA